MKELSVLDCVPVAKWIAKLQRMAISKQHHEWFAGEYGSYPPTYNIVKNHVQRLAKDLKEYRLLSRDFRCY